MVADVYNLTVGKPYTPVATAVTGFAALGDVANLLTLQPSEVIAVPSGASSIVYDLGAVVTLRQVALMYSNFLAADTVRVRCSLSSNGTTSPLFDSAATVLDAQALLRPDGQRHWFFHHTADVSCRYVRIDFATAAARTLGRLVLCAPLQLEYNVDYGDTSWGYDEADDGEELESGVEVIVERAARPVLNFTASWVTQAEMDAGWEELGRLQHEGTPVLVVRRPDPHTGRHNGMYYGILRMVPIVAADFDMFEVQGRIRSMI